MGFSVKSCLCCGAKSDNFASSFRKGAKQNISAVGNALKREPPPTVVISPTPSVSSHANSFSSAPDGETSGPQPNRSALRPVSCSPSVLTLPSPSPPAPTATLRTSAPECPEPVVSPPAPRVTARIEDERCVIGVDLGTSFCCVAVLRDSGVVEIIANDDTGGGIMPSSVAFTEDARYVGIAAKKHGQIHPEQCIFEVKRLMGRLFTEQSVQEDAQTWPFYVLSGPHGEALVGVPSHPPPTGGMTRFEPEDISAMVLGKLKETAENFIGGKTLTDAVITVPAYFNDSQRPDGGGAGVRSPDASEIQILRKEDSVFDLGGGTFDVSIMTVEANAEDESKFTVNAVAGDPHLGGADFDNRLLKFVAGKFARENGVDVFSDRRLRSQAKEAAVKAKESLSSAWETEVRLEVGAEVLSTTITRAAFEWLNSDYFDKCMAIVAEALRGAKMKKSDISEVLLVGGSTRIPIVREKLTAFFGTPPLTCLQADEAVAYGAAVQARLVRDNGYLVPPPPPPPPPHQEPQGNSCPDPPPGNCLSDLSRPPMRLRPTGRPPIRIRVWARDVAQFTIGTDSGIDFMIPLITRNTPIPVEVEESICYDSDGQRELIFKLYEGVRAACSLNRFLGQFALPGFTPANADGRPVARLIVNMNRDGILEVTAEAIANHAEVGKRAGVKVETVLHKGESHVISALAGAAGCNTPEAEDEDAALTAAYESRLKLQTLAWSIRDRSSRAVNEASKKASQVLNWLDGQMRLQPQLEYDRRLEELQNLDSGACSASTSESVTTSRDTMATEV
ncbi:hypothetical protein CBR_g50036 [Chara braunii]|uniref:Uncharacterized protein n=1 Tax=Chara braunii TaxID=69332 RepID=A0A388M5X9_CHABU|nr:hypothetical protein CBR_g50036 [Chara braunii]|eukprot:GBG89946.1 hypothetical protein CBR_g50036 [Chara braunii]